MRTDVLDHLRCHPRMHLVPKRFWQPSPQVGVGESVLTHDLEVARVAAGTGLEIREAISPGRIGERSSTENCAKYSGLTRQNSPSPGTLHERRGGRRKSSSKLPDRSSKLVT
jgi:hypothetical protein